MPKRIPAYRHHRQSGNAIVTLPCSRTRRRKDVLLGEHDSAESRSLYAEVIAAWEAAGRVVDAPAAEARKHTSEHVGVVTCARVAVEFTKHMERRYANRRNHDRLYHVRGAMKVWRAEFGKLPADEFGPLALRNLRDVFIAEGYSRKIVNDRIRLVQAAVEHGVSIEIVCPDKLTAIRAVKPLRRGEGGTEGDKVKPAPNAHIEAIRTHVAPQVWALVELQLLTGARPNEVLIMRLQDIDTSGKVWLYRPQFHKRDDDPGRERIILLGPRAQRVVEPFMVDRAVDTFVFNPREGNAYRKGMGKRGRREDQQPNPRKTERRIGGRYTPASYRRAVTRACEAAGVPVWHPRQLRHNAATAIRREAGVEASSIVLGHSSTTLTDAVYAERDLSKAAAIIARVG